MALTEKGIEKLEPGERTVIHWDDRQPGLGLRVTANDARAWVLDYRTAEGTRRRMTIGKPSLLSLKAARKRAKAHLGKIEDGADPLARKREVKAEPTVADLCTMFDERWIVKRLGLGKMQPSTAHEYRRQIAKYIVPEIGKRRATTIGETEVEKLRSGLPGFQGNRVIGLMRTIYRKSAIWLPKLDLRDPTATVDRAAEPKRIRTLDADEMGRLGQALAAAEAREGALMQALLAIRLAAVSGLRIDEVRRLRWADTDMRSGRAILRQTKTGDRVHRLPTPALAALAAAPKAGEFVIFGRRTDQPLDYSTIRRVWAALCKEAKIEGARLHDLRRSAMTRAAASGAGAHLVRDLLGHSTSAAADDYVVSAGADVDNLRERVGSEAAALLEGRKPAPVHPLHRAG